MDDTEDALGKLSRQLSELATTPVTGGSPDPLNDGLRWTQFSGMPQHRNLYTWNPMDLPDFKPLSPPKHDVHPNHQHTSPSAHQLTTPPASFGHDEFASKNQFEWYSESTTPQYPISGHGLAPTGRNNFSHQNYLFQEEPPLPEHGFGYEPVDYSLPSLHRHDFYTSAAANNLGTEISSNFLKSDTTHPLFHNYSSLDESTLPEGAEHLSFGMPSENVHQMFSPPLFDPSSPPPIFPGAKHLSGRSPSPPLSGDDGARDQLRPRSKVNINLDLGISVDRGSHIYSEVTPKAVGSAENSFGQKSHSFDQSSRLAHPPSPDVLPEQGVSDTSKPTYSDIAKTPKLGPAGKNDQPSLDLSNRGQVNRQLKKDVKPLRPQVKRTSSGSKFWPKSPQTGDTNQPHPNRYGLDNFNDGILFPGSHSSSSESISQVARSRRGSGSSGGSSTGNAEDLVSPSSSATYLDTNQDQKQANHSPAETQKLFFDPRRIFQTKNTKPKSPSVQGKSKENLSHNEPGKASPPSDTVLNNGKPTANNTSKLSSSARQHDYINNVLRDSKLTNQTAAGSAQGKSGKLDDLPKEKETRTEKRSSGKPTNGLYRRERRNRNSDNSHTDVDQADGMHHEGGNGFLSDYFDRDKIEEWCYVCWEKFSQWGNTFISSLLNLLIYLFGLVLYIAVGSVHLFLMLLGKGWNMVKEKLGKGQFDTKEGNSWNSREHLRRRVGLEESISLPATGEEAMKRLLACKGKDPYSILGLRADSSDEDIKKYYRKQAVLVHPDKNQEPGAEEAFKILGHAFEMIGDSSRRKQYDSHTQEANEADAMREFAEMLSKLQTKIQEAANIMRCDNCAGKHQRFPVDRPFYSARFCQRCNTRHAAKEGDVWAESTMLGFRWHYFALMEGNVFDITEWMACHKEHFKHMKANVHGVMYRIATDGSKRNKRQQSGEPSLEDFINRLFKSNASAGDGQSASWGSPHSGEETSWGHSGSASAAAAAKQKGRRTKKKRH